MDITVVGSGTVVPRLERRQSCVVVGSGGETLVFDLGSGAVRGMLRAGLDPFAVDRIFFTHFHPDHTVDVVPLLFSIKYGAEEKARPSPAPDRSRAVRAFLGLGYRRLGQVDDRRLPDRSLRATPCVPSPLDLPGAFSPGPQRSTARRASPTASM